MKMDSILEAIRQHAAKNPEKLCIVDETGELSYKNYWNRIKGIAELLKLKNVQKGDCVAVKTMQNSFFTAAAMGIQLAGGIFVPIEKNAPEDRVRNIIKETEAKYIIGTDESGDKAKYIEYQEIKEFIEKNAAGASEFDLPQGKDIAEILFTTGTTGESKGIVISHESNVALAENIAYGVEMKADNVELIPVPINHSYGLRSYYASMLNGSTVILVDGTFDLKRFFEYMDKFRVTSLALVPAAISIIVKLSKDLLSKYEDRIDYVQSGSASLSEDLKQTLCRLLPKSRLYNFYGSTEAGRCCILNYNKEKDKVSCIGKPAHNAKFSVIDEQGNFTDSSRDNPGRLACAGRMNMTCYWKDPQKTSQVLNRGYVLTNDICFIEDGYVYFVGRQGDVINVGGNKVAPIEVEEAAMTARCVSECVCVPVKDPYTGNAPKLLVVVKEGMELDKQDIVEKLSSRLDSFKVPKIIEQIAEIPRMYNGKIDRKALIDN